MKTIALIAPLFMGVLSALSQVPTAPFAYSFTTPALWDFSGHYQKQIFDDALTFEVVHSPKGIITGVQTQLYADDTMSLSGSAYIKGRVFWRPDSVGFRVTPFTETMTRTANGQGVLAHATAHANATLEPTLLALQTTNVCRVRLSANTYVKLTDCGRFSLPAGMTGAWTLTFTLAQDGNTVSGAAQISLSNGRVLNYEVKGAYNARTQVSTLRLVGYLETRGSSLLVKTQGSHMQLWSLSGTVLGQKVKL